MATVDRVLELVGGYCDLEERLALVPPSARIRGLFFRTVTKGVQMGGKLEEYRELVQHAQFSTLRFYPVADYLVHLAAGGAVLAGPQGVHHGIHEVSRGNALAFAESLLGRTLLRVLSPEPQLLIRQGVAGKRQGTTYGRWGATFPGPREAIVEYHDEYVWIESSMLGAARGTFEVVGIHPDIEVEMRDPFNGRFRIRW